MSGLIYACVKKQGDGEYVTKQDPYGFNRVKVMCSKCGLFTKWIEYSQYYRSIKDKAYNVDQKYQLEGDCNTQAVYCCKHEECKAKPFHTRSLPRFNVHQLKYGNIKGDVVFMERNIDVYEPPKLWHYVHPVEGGRYIMCDKIPQSQIDKEVVEVEDVEELDQMDHSTTIWDIL